MKPPVYAPIDANGNLTSDGSRTFEWDARNQLLAVNVGSHRSEFTYDGDRRRVRVVEKESSVVQSDSTDAVSRLRHDHWPVAERGSAGLAEGPNLYAYVGSNPLNTLSPATGDCARQRGIRELIYEQGSRAIFGLTRRIVEHKSSLVSVKMDECLMCSM